MDSLVVDIVAGLIIVGLLGMFAGWRLRHFTKHENQPPRATARIAGGVLLIMGFLSFALGVLMLVLPMPQ